MNLDGSSEIAVVIVVAPFSWKNNCNESTLSTKKAGVAPLFAWLIRALNELATALKWRACTKYKLDSERAMHQLKSHKVGFLLP